MIRLGRKGIAAVLAVLLAGCSHGPVRVDCERHLVPINAPAPSGVTGKSKAPSPVVSGEAQP